MSNSIVTLPQIKKSIIIGLTIQYVPILVISSVEPLIETKADLETIIALISLLLAIVPFIFGYALFGNAINKYAQHKGYKNYFWIYSILNIFGLSILFLLASKNLSHNTKSKRNSLLNFSILSIFISWIAIPIAIMPFICLIALYINGINGFEEYILDSNNKFIAITDISTKLILAWYFFKELQKSNIDYKNILGGLKQINFKLPIILTIFEYFFNGGINSLTLYGLSFVIPQYVEHRINYQYATTIVGYIAFTISTIIYAPIIEEFFFRGIIFQKLALTKGIVKAMVISAIAFALVHFRYDLIPLFICGILYVILYLKTKQLAVPILAHFFYNAIVVGRRIYVYFFSSVDPSLHITIADYQQQFLEHWQWNILYISLSAPYLCYFIYKNFPRNYDINKLPYFANQQISER